MEASEISIFENFACKISPEKIDGIEAVIQIELTGKKADIWHITLKDGMQEIKNSPAESPTLILTCDSADFVRLVNGQLNIMQSFMSGKLRISGDMSAAMKLAKLLG